MAGRMGSFNMCLSGTRLDFLYTFRLDRYSIFRSPAKRFSHSFGWLIADIACKQIHEFISLRIVNFALCFLCCMRCRGCGSWSCWIRWMRRDSRNHKSCRTARTIRVGRSVSIVALPISCEITERLLCFLCCRRRHSTVITRGLDRFASLFSLNAARHGCCNIDCYWCF
jgi:hypothetical protein